MLYYTILYYTILRDKKSYYASENLMMQNDIK